MSMLATDELARFRSAGVVIQITGTDLEVTAPVGGLSEEDWERLALLKPFIIAALRAEAWTADPRPDLADNTHLWSQLLTAANHLDGHDQSGAFSVAHGCRCLGAALVWRDGRWRLERGEVDSAEWAVIRERWLLPHRIAFADLLANLPASAVPLMGGSS